MGLNTTLIHPDYVNAKFEKVPGIKSGLKIMDKFNNHFDLEYNEDEIVIQMSDYSFFYSEGRVVATPHAVFADKDIPNDVYRIQFSNFLNPYLDFKIPIEQGQKNLQYLIDKDPYKGRFMSKTFATYHGQDFYDHFTKGIQLSFDH